MTPDTEDNLRAICAQVPGFRSVVMGEESETAYEFRAKFWSEKYGECIYLRTFMEQELIDDPQYWHVAVDLLRRSIDSKQEEHGQAHRVSTLAR